jgi:hypothetical protein
MNDTTMMDMNTIELQRSAAAACWVAVHKGPHAEEIVRLFGTDTLPTAFTAAARAETVHRVIADLNPNCRVMVTR